ncbi:MAG: hypothetical protein ACI9J3_004122 [Parvicellaceae bacterium]|jgi:hypothetical protein
MRILVILIVLLPFTGFAQQMSFSFGTGFGTTGNSTEYHHGFADSNYWNLKLNSSPSVNLNALYVKIHGLLQSPSMVTTLLLNTE